jgi:predicted ATPase
VATANRGYRASFAFDHSLIRDTAYEAIAKEHRADLHERYANWLERYARGSFTQVDELVGHHLEQAHRNLAEIGRNDERTRHLARRAGEVLAAVGRRAAEQGGISEATGSSAGCDT